MEALDAVSFILLLPKRAGNVGAVARIMKNFGIADLRVVSRRAPAATFAAKKMAVHGADVLRRCRTFDSLPAALKGLHIVVGTTGKDHKDAPPSITPDGLGGLLSRATANRIGVLFGPEDRGLSGDELALCTHSLTIPSSPAYPSLNLSHAAGIVAWELYRRAAEFPAAPARRLATRQSMERMYAAMAELYLEIGFLDKINPLRIMKLLRAIYDRAELDEREVRILMGVVRQMNWYRTKSAAKDR